MRWILLMALLSMFNYSSSQNVDRFADSLTGAIQRTFTRTDGMTFSKVDSVCSFGGDFIFYKQQRKVTWHVCDKGKWKEESGIWNVISENGIHTIQIMDKDNKMLGKLDVQLVAMNGKSVNRITQFIENSKEIIYYYYPPK
jgi:hypothetical protein